MAESLDDHPCADCAEALKLSTVGRIACTIRGELVTDICAKFRGEKTAQEAEWVQRAHYHLLGWAEWRGIASGTVTHGFDSRSVGLSSGYRSMEFEHLLQIVEACAGEKCNTIIYELEQIHIDALENRYIYQSVFRHNRYPDAQLLIDAQWAFWGRARKYVE